MFKRLYQKIINHFRKAEEYSVPRFILEFGILSIILRFATALLLVLGVVLYLSAMLVINPKFDTEHFRLPDYEQEVIKKIEKEQKISIKDVTDLGIITPLIETGLFQMFPLWLLSRFIKRKKIIIIISALFFAAAHGNVIISFFIVPLAFILAWSFIVMRNRSLWKAYLTTASIHSIFNLSSLILIGITK